MDGYEVSRLLAFVGTTETRSKDGVLFITEQCVYKKIYYTLGSPHSVGAF